MMSRINPLYTAVVVSICCVVSIFVGRRTTGSEAAPISGVLYTTALDSTTVRTEFRTPPEPPVTVAGQNGPKSSIASTAGAGVQRKSRPRRTPAPVEPPPQIVAAPIVAQVADPAPPPPPVVIAPPVAKPKPPQAMTFVELDEALRQSSTAQTLNLRTKQGGITFRVTHVGRLADRGVVRFNIANEESADFFISVVNISQSRKPLPSETAGPYACRAGEEIAGAVHFLSSAVSGRTITVELVQSGGARRRFSLKLDYIF